MVKIIRYVATNDRGYRIGQYHQNAKVSDKKIDEIREHYENHVKLTHVLIAKATGVPLGTIRNWCGYFRRAGYYEHWKKVEPYPSPWGDDDHESVGTGIKQLDLFENNDPVPSPDAMRKEEDP